MTFTATRRSLPQPPSSAQPVQKKFPRRARLSVPSTKSELRQRRMRRKNQSTLTQLPYFSSFDSKDDEDRSELSDPDFEDPQPKKKRKTMARAAAKTKEQEEEELKQATLTQIGWPYPIHDSDEDEEVEGDDAGSALEIGSSKAADETLVQEDEENDGQVDHTEALEENIAPQSQQTQQALASRSISAVSSHTRSTRRRVSRSPQTSPPTSRPSISHPPQKQRFSPSPELGMSASATRFSQEIPVSPFKTPQRSVKNEIPSSQSPAATPLSRSSAAAASSSKSTPTRTPLSELHKNVWAQRDESPSPKPKAKLKVVPNSEDTDELDKENLMDDLENYDGYLSDDGPTEGTPQKPAATMSQPSSSRATRTMRSGGPSSETFIRPPLPTTSRASRCQRLSSSCSAADPTQAEPSMSSFRHQVAHLAPPMLAPDDKDAIRPSQATTVDVTQRSPQSKHNSPLKFVPSSGPQVVEDQSSQQLPSQNTRPQHSLTPQQSTARDRAVDLPPGYNPNIPPLPSSPRAFESQFPYSMFSVCEDESQTYAPGHGMRALDSDDDM